jgi:aminopeptidase N
MGYRADNNRTGGVTRDIIYPKGGFILHMIRMMMYDHRTASDARFVAMMRDFVKTHYNRNASTEDFKTIVDRHMTPEMNAGGNKTMDWFFDGYVYGTAIPTYKIDYRFETSGKQTIVRGRVTQSDVPAGFRMIVPIYFERDDRKIGRLGAVTLAGNASQDFSATLDFRPRRMMLAAYEDVLANIEGR